ncbi:hypothetical protein F4561_006432 [Lipingzhangella halophila]|uniref:DUF998 domain-containing protein n=1 Tax=Lipingzhangella halophila TaxID=1783352 RepID=A0A7W7RP07_9ACTN|nr:DUF998 domain-containing protein [Lipingzhangella halophila]MBB4935538.1 hypothetical protein [Lipingzhangella halophila]
MSGAPVRRRATWALLACGLAVPLFVVVLLVEGAFRPDYASLHRFGSELSLGERGWVQTTNFVVTGVLLLGFALGLRRALATGRGSSAVPVLTAIVGASLVVGGLFATDPAIGYPAGSTPPAEPTLSGRIHDGNVVPFYLALTAVIAVLAWRSAVEPGARWWMWYCVATAVLVPVTFGFAAAQVDDVTGVGTFHGLWQRVSLAIGLGWFGALALRLMRRCTAPPGPGGAGLPARH